MTYFDAHLQNYNNAILYSQNASPFVSPYYNTETPLFKYQYLQSVQSQVAQPISKKWYGNSQNQLSSQRTQQKKNVAIGRGSYNNQGVSTSQVPNDTTNRRDEQSALQRVRNRGWVKPKKYNISSHITGISPQFMAGSLVRSSNRSVATAQPYYAFDYKTQFAGNRRGH